MMLADLDLLLTAVFATADALLPDRARNARRSVTDAEVVTLAVAQAVMDVPSDREFLRSPPSGCGTCFPSCPDSPAIGSGGSSGVSDSTARAWPLLWQHPLGTASDGLRRRVSPAAGLLVGVDVHDPHGGAKQQFGTCREVGALRLLEVIRSAASVDLDRETGILRTVDRDSCSQRLADEHGWTRADLRAFACEQVASLRF
jgi:hypothetical protein